MVVQNTFQILLTGEYTKSSIFYADVVIVYINPGGGHHDRDATLNNTSVIPWRPALLVGETGYTRKNYRPAACH
jgi:hypothetical protein